MKVSFCGSDYVIDEAMVGAIVYSNKEENTNHPIVRQFSRHSEEIMISHILSSRLIEQQLEGNTMDDALAMLKKDEKVFPDAPSLDSSEEDLRAYVEALYNYFPCYIGDTYFTGDNLYFGTLEDKIAIEFDVF
jgi:hypothetical protein